MATTARFGVHAGRDVPHAGHKGHFVRHFLEMVVAMFIGMGIGKILFTGIFAAADMTYDEALVRYTAPCLIMMAFNMSVPMALWMRHRGHAWRSTGEMVAAMFVPAFALIGLLWVHVLTNDGPVFALLHVAMIPAMIIAMYVRRAEYGSMTPANEE